MLKIKPGILVALKTSVKGGVTYERVDLERKVDPEGSEHARWEATRHIADLEELGRAGTARSKARHAIAKHCARTAWGLICLDADEPALVEGIAEAHAIAADHNAGAKHSKLEVSVFLGRVARDDVEAVRAVQQEVAGLLEQAEKSALHGDVKAMRDAAWRAKEMVKLLDEGEVHEALDGAIKALRKVARDVTRLVEKKGEELEEVLTAEHLQPITSARYRFNQLSVTEHEMLPAVNEARFGGLEGGTQ